MKTKQLRAREIAKGTGPNSKALIFALCLVPSACFAKVLDRTVATVNDQAIMLSEFEKNAAPILEQFKKTSPQAEQTPDRIQDIKKRVLDQMIDDRLLIAEAK